MAIGKRPKLTLGLKKKSEENGTSDEEQPTVDKPKLTLGLRKKRETNKLFVRGDAQTTSEKYTQSLTSPIKKKSEVIFHPRHGEHSVTTPTERRIRPPMGFRKRSGGTRPPEVERSQKASIIRHTNVKVQKTKGKLEVNIKISQLPNWVQTIKRGWQRFCVNADGQIVQMKVRPRTWNKLLKANEEYPMWIASITGKMGHRIKDGFELLEPAIQVYEKKSQPSTMTEQ